MGMDDYYEEVTSPCSTAQPLDQTVIDDYRAQTHIRTTPDFFELTCQNSKDFTVGSMSREWTNEKHSLFLNLMEASFVRRLHHQEYDSRDSLHCRNVLLQPSNQFKMQQSGCWKNTNYELCQPKTNTLDERCALMDNQWIRRFRYVGKQREYALPNQHENGARSGESIYLGGQKLECPNAASCGATMHAKKLHIHYSHQRDQDYVSSNIEASDQNFVEEDDEETYSINHLKGKKMKKTTTDSEQRSGCSAQSVCSNSGS